MAKNRPKTDHLSENELIIRDRLLYELRKVLRHLYDPEELRKSIFTHLLPVDEEQGPSSLQRILVTAIEALKPSSSLSPQSSAWRIYNILSSRYIQQFHQNEVAKSLGLSQRQIRRQDNLALRALMEYLWVHFNLGEVTQQKPLDEILSDNEPDSVLDIPSQEDELQWLEKSQESEVIGVEDLIKPLLKTVDPLARRLSVSIELDLPDDLPKLIVAITPARQAFLVLLTAIIRLFPESGLRINGITKGKHILLNIVPIHFKQATFTLLTGSSENISFARRLVALTGGEILVLLESQETPLGGIQLILPAFEQVSVLVIDDNQDALQLYQRYFTGTRYAFYGTSYPDQALSLVERLAPNIIILDVMLPGVDGWELLSLIREHPKIHGTPVVVATILPQEELALALGAAAYVRKPVNQTELLKTLDALVSQSSQEYR